ncbi:MAG: hypothetical protein F8N15_06520, partial [Methanobacterium sp.]|nr:hypothetical protein [Methanobacterium sp.]
LIVVVIVLLVAGVVAFSLTGNNNITKNNSSITNNSQNTVSNSSGVVKIVAKQSGPETAKKGDNVTINYTISNEGSAAVQNVKISSQNFDNTIGTLNVNETKSYSYILHIPTDEEVQEDFGPNATVSNPFSIGGFAVSFTDSSGSIHSINANSIEIKLV